MMRLRNLFSGQPAATGYVAEAWPKELRHLVNEFIWKTNPAPKRLAADVRLHVGCGDNPIANFVNVDFLPVESSVLGWNLLDRWPDELQGRVRCAFSEDVLEHFFYEEQNFLLCEMNRMLAPGGVFRVLMPSLELLVRTGRDFDAQKTVDFFAQNFGIGFGADAINLGMRFGGHRWLHDTASFTALARRCGFEATPTSCGDSVLPELSGLNLRDETNSLSFAFDLTKTANLSCWRLDPHEVVGARQVGELAEEQPLFTSTGSDPQVHYRFEEKLNTDRIALLAIRGANLSQFREHSYSEAYLMNRTDRALPIDSSMRSTHHTSFIAAPMVASRHSGELTNSLRFDPASRSGDHFTTGPAEIFFREEEAAADA